MKKSMVLLIAVVSFVLGGLALHYKSDYEGREERLEVLDAEAHNKNMNACVAKALEKHPGALMEVELEKEDGRWVFDIDVQAKDGKTWDIECDVNSAEIVEDSIDRD
jgi:uncharacterized membrane protein YkoI